MTERSGTSNTYSDVDLLEMIKKKEGHTFDLLYKKYWNSLLHYAAQYLEDEDSCKEIVQDLFVHLHSRQALLKIRSSISSYLYTALRNRIANYVRNRTVYKKHMLLAVSEGPSTQNDVEQFINLVDLQNEIAHSLEQMPLKYREVYVLHKQNHFTIKKIALILKRPSDTVEKQLRRAKALLRVHLKDIMLIT
jgi:RNA polymerase sigma-70 factor (ECF subfamily)